MPRRRVLRVRLRAVVPYRIPSDATHQGKKSRQLFRILDLTPSPATFELDLAELKGRDFLNVKIMSPTASRVSDKRTLGVAISELTLERQALRLDLSA